jgi:hypothetical protein
MLSTLVVDIATAANRKQAALKWLCHNIHAGLQQQERYVETQDSGAVHVHDQC